MGGAALLDSPPPHPTPSPGVAWFPIGFANRAPLSVADLGQVKALNYSSNNGDSEVAPPLLSAGPSLETSPSLARRAA